MGEGVVEGEGVGTDDSRTRGGGGSVATGGSSTGIGAWVGRAWGSTVGAGALDDGAGLEGSSGIVGSSATGGKAGPGVVRASGAAVGAGSEGIPAASGSGGAAGISALASWIRSVGAAFEAGRARANAPAWTVARPLPWATTLVPLTASRIPCWAREIPFLSWATSASFRSPWRASTARKKLRARVYSRYAR